MTEYEHVHDWDNLWVAWQNAARGKRSRLSVAGFEYRLAEELVSIQDELRNRLYRPGPYQSFYVHEPKRRLISAAPFRDRVVHHALCNIIGPTLERAFVRESFANRPGFGTHRALDWCQIQARRYRYFLLCDLEQFFASIDHEILLGALARKITDPDVMTLVRSIVGGGSGILATEYKMRFFPGDDLFAAGRPRGLPIGNLTSQLWANYYLNPLDHYVKRELRIEGYVRYVDDFILFAEDKKQLWTALRGIETRLAQLRLTLHPQTQPRQVAEGIPFLGFRIFPQRRKLKPRKGIYFQRRLKLMWHEFKSGSLKPETLTTRLRSWINHVRYGNTIGLRKSIFKKTMVKKIDKSSFLNPPKKNSTGAEPQTP